MSVRRLAPSSVQPDSFAFNKANEAWVREQIKKYPDGRQRSAVIPLLMRAQEQQGGWVTEKAIEVIAERLDMAPMRVLEVATFYTQFNLAPVGEFFVQLCGTTPCMLCGSEALKDICQEIIGEQGEVTSDGKLSWIEVECLGACVNAPMCLINSDTYEDLTPEIFRQLLDKLRAGEKVTPGSQSGRLSSEPLSGRRTLLDDAKKPVRKTAKKAVASGSDKEAAAEAPGDKTAVKAKRGAASVKTGKSEAVKKPAAKKAATKVSKKDS